MGSVHRLSAGGFAAPFQPAYAVKQLHASASAASPHRWLSWGRHHGAGLGSRKPEPVGVRRLPAAEHGIGAVHPGWAVPIASGAYQAGAACYRR
jgi:hypothetical protein